MKPSRPKKGKSSTGSDSRGTDALRPEQAAVSAGAEFGAQNDQQPRSPAAPANPSAQASTGREPVASKQGRRDRDNQKTPPVRIVGDLPPERKPLLEQARTLQPSQAERAQIARLSPQHIAERAYALYEAGGYEQGKEVEHWLEAERQLQAEARVRDS